MPTITWGIKVNSVKQFPDVKVDLRYCPVCAYLETQKAIEAMVCDIKCTSCGKSKFSEFKILGNGFERKTLLNSLFDRMANK